MYDSLTDSLSNAYPPQLPPAPLEEKSMSVYELLMSGGIMGNIIIVVLFILLFLSLYIFFERYFNITKSTHSNSRLIQEVGELVHETRIDSAIDLCKRTPSPEARMIQKGLMRIGRPIKDISDAIENQATLEVYRLEKNLNILATIAGAAPMLGFLGTVIGMIISFYDIANSTGQVNAKMLSGGIYTAMGTTAVGLVVGIISYLFYNFLVVKVEKTIFLLQNSATDFLDLLNKPLLKA